MAVAELVPKIAIPDSFHANLLGQMENTRVVMA